MTREEAVARIKDHIEIHRYHERNAAKVFEALDMAIEALRQPECKKGKWIKMSDADGIYWACSECGEDIPRVPHYNPQFDLFPRLESIEKTNFCPNCGADMKGE